MSVTYNSPVNHSRVSVSCCYVEYCDAVVLVFSNINLLVPPFILLPHKKGCFVKTRHFHGGRKFKPEAVPHSKKRLLTKAFHFGSIKSGEKCQSHIKCDLFSLFYLEFPEQNHKHLMLPW